MFKIISKNNRLEEIVKILYFFIFNFFIFLNAGKHGPEFVQARTLFTQLLRTASSVLTHSKAICDVLRDLVPFAQFKKRENTHGGVLLLVKLQVFSFMDFLTFFKLYKWYQIAKSITIKYDLNSLA